MRSRRCCWLTGWRAGEGRAVICRRGSSRWRVHQRRNGIAALRAWPGRAKKPSTSPCVHWPGAWLRLASQARNAADWVSAWRAAWLRAGPIGPFSVAARSLRRVCQVANRCRSLRCASSVIPASQVVSHCSNSSRKRSASGSVPQAMSRSRTWMTDRQGDRVLRPSWVSGTCPRARAARSGGMCGLLIHKIPARGLFIWRIASWNGTSSGRIWPVPSSSSTASRSVRTQCPQVFLVCRRASRPHRPQVNPTVIPAHGGHSGRPLASSPGVSRCRPQPAQEA